MAACIVRALPHVDTMNLFLLADALAVLAELVVAVVVPWWLSTGGGAHALAGYGVAVAVSTLVAVPLASPLGDRHCKATQAMLGLAALGIAFMAYAACAATRFQLAPAIGIAVLAACANAFAGPARSAILPELVPAGRLAEAIQRQKSWRALAGVAGPLLGGLGLASVGAAASLGVAAGLMLVAACVAAAVPRSAALGTLARAGWWAALRAGAAAKWQVPMERGWTLVNFVVWIFQGPAVGMLVPVKVQSLGLAGQWLGVAMGALSVGSLLGSVFGSQWLVQQFGRYRVRLALACMEGLCLACVGLAGSQALLVAGLLMCGFCNACMSLVGATHRALAIPRDFRVRLQAASTVSTQVAGAIGPALAAMALLRWPVDGVYVAFGLLMAASGLGLAWVPRIQEFFDLDHDQATDWYARQYPQVFRPAAARPWAGAGRSEAGLAE